MLPCDYLDGVQTIEEVRRSAAINLDEHQGERRWWESHSAAIGWLRHAEYC